MRFHVKHLGTRPSSVAFDPKQYKLFTFDAKNYKLSQGAEVFNSLILISKKPAGTETWT